MSLAPREKRTVLIGVAIALAVGGYTWGLRPLLQKQRAAAPLAVPQGNRFEDACSRIERAKQVQVDLEKLTGEVGVEIPTEAPLDQMKQLVDKFEALSGRAKVKINNMTELRSRAARKTTRAAERTELKLDLTCPSLVALVRFLDGLEAMTIPIVFDQISITSSGGRGGSSPRGGGSSAPGGGRNEGGGPERGDRERGGPSGRQRGGGQVQMQTTLKIHTYLFPEKVQQ